jgi:hypothetical protein
LLKKEAGKVKGKMKNENEACSYILPFAFCIQAAFFSGLVGVAGHLRPRPQAAC